MKNLVKNLMAVIAVTFVVAGCEKSDDGRNTMNAVSPRVLEAFAARYPGAENVSWQMKGNYAVADFYWTGTRASNGRTNASAWFDNTDGAWSMTETDILFNALPQAVKDAFAASEYASWQVDPEVDVLYRNGEVDPEIYVIEVAQSGREMDLYYSPDGVLVKTMADSGADYDYGDFIPSKPTSGIEAYLQQYYPSARIIDVDAEAGGTEIEIVDNGVKRDLFFDRGEQWQYTKTEVRRSDLPELVLAAWAASEYAESQDYRLDDADYFETAADGDYYRLELESRRGDVKLKITPQGEFSLYEPGSEGGNAGVPVDADLFIQQTYPGATVLEKEYDDGYLEVEIRHEGYVKEVRFNGSGAWVGTSWEVRWSDLPAAVTAAIGASAYAQWTFDGADHIQTPDGEWFEIELEERLSDREVTLRIAPDGSMRN